MFQNVCISPLSIAYKAVSYLYDSSIVNRPAGMQPLQLGISSIQVCWSCPAAEWIKLNMDGLLRPFHSLEVQVLCLEIARLAVFLLAVRVLNKEDPLPWFFYSLREIFALLDLIVEWRVTHVFREGHQCFHWFVSFAKWSRFGLFVTSCSDEQGVSCNTFLK